ncbi:nacht and tpr domain containing protein [Grosmannia clavigera kw1407]|uniref:Nacht and tpr domain containing protein n=1 Tax=Grosmannia clavigera (strain kw1407 / UAMH 11150) TaxID=655863 RepID=F0XCL0_GROCL|nr:nacht and tpr domain containing protein [Grosmannia clavigera kw1407]EFX04362.1 nacht and tpr domain containing protein [Grosmannia clavigera kw1407]
MTTAATSTTGSGPVSVAFASSIDRDSEDYRELSKVWKDVESRVQRLAETRTLSLAGQVPSLQRNLDIDGVLKIMKKSKEYSEKETVKYARVEKAISTTLRCISNIGGIIADGVSTVFEPAQTCYNALTFVIQAWQGYVGIFENLADLLERCVEFLERLDHYKAYMDVKLTRVAVQYLNLFVDICDRSIRLRKKHVKLLAFTKMLFLNDDEVRSHLTDMGKLFDKERGLVLAQVFNSTNDNSASLKGLAKDNNDQKKESEGRRWRKTIAKTLGFEPGDLDPDSEPVAKWRTMLNKYKNLLSLLEDTGQWIMDDADGPFMQWATGASNREVPPILLLNGERGSGKTFMMANVIKYLGKMDGIASKAVLSYFFVQPDPKQAGLRDGVSILEAVSRSLLWQCAVGSETMTRSIGQMCEKGRDLVGAVDMWSKLFLNNAERQKTDTVFYLFVDGLDDMSLVLPLLRRISADKAERRVRVFLTTTPKLQNQLGSLDFRCIEIHGRKKKGIAHGKKDKHPVHSNDKDIASYICYRMNQMDILKDSTRPGIDEWRRKIREELQVKCDGDYCKLVTSLDAIANADFVDDIQAVLDNAHGTRANQIVAEIERLNRARTLKERIEINEIILWIQGGESWLSVEAMEAVLAVKHNNGPAMTSLLLFDVKIKNKYPIFQIDSSGNVNFRSDEVETAISARTVSASSTSPKRITNGEISLVQHLLITFCPPDLYGRFQFDHFFAHKADPPLHSTDICSDPDNMHIRIALSSLMVLTSPKDKPTAAIRHYARVNLLKHLCKTDLDRADKGLKAATGQLLVALFTRDVGIDALFWIECDTVSQQRWEMEENRFLRLVRVDWLYSFDGVDILLKWFCDADVVHEIATNTREGAFVAAFTKQGANRHEVLFKPAAKRLAQKLLCFDHCSLREAHTWLFFLNGFMDKLPRQEMKPVTLGSVQTPAQLETGGSDRGDVGTENDGTVRPLNGNDQHDGNDDLPEIPRSADAINELDGVAFRKIEKRKVSLAQLTRIENWASIALEKSGACEPLWEVQMAAIISYSCNHLKAETIADRRAHKALKKDPSHWLVCYYLSCSEAKDEASINLLLRSLQSIEKIQNSSDKTRWNAARDHQLILAHIHLRLGHRYWKTGQFEKAVQHHQESFKFSGTRFREYIEALLLYSGEKHWDEVIALLGWILDCVEQWPPYFNELYTILISNPKFDAVVPAAANALDRWDTVENLFAQATRIARKREDWDSTFGMLKSLGDMLYKHDADLERHETGVVASWAAAIEVLVAHPSDGIAMGSVTEIANNLSRIYLEQALRHLREAGGRVPEDKAKEVEATQLLDKITALVFPDVAPMWNRTVLCCVARYHVQVGNMVEAKKAVADLMEAIMAMLSDDDPSNDEWAMMCLAGVVNVFADEENTIAAWQVVNLIQTEAITARRAWEEMIPDGEMSESRGSIAEVEVDDGEGAESAAGENASFTTLDTTDEDAHTSVSGSVESDHVTTDGETVATEDVDDASSVSFGSIPDAPVALLICGGCNEEFLYASQAYMCCDCVGTVSFDEKCYQRLQKGELCRSTPSVCNKAHHFVYLPKWDDEAAKTVPKGSLPMGSDTIRLEDWKKGLRAKYMDLGL